MRKAGSILFTAIFLLMFSVSIAMAQPIDATFTISVVYVDSEQINFGSYNIAGSNFFKLRDLAYVLNGTNKQFAVVWDADANAINIKSNRPYSPVGGEVSAENYSSGNRDAKPTTAKVYLDNQEMTLTAYNIDGNNYFKLRDIGQALDFGILWDEAVRCVIIESGQSYTPETEIMYWNNIATFIGKVTTEDPSPMPPPTTILEEYALEVVRLTNEERAKQGLPPLTADRGMFAAAQLRVQELTKTFSHKRLNGAHFNSVFKEFDIIYSGCCENIAYGQNSPQRVVKAWMASFGHRENMMDDYTKIGIGVIESSGLYYWDMLLIQD